MPKVARPARAFNVKREIDPETKTEIPLNIKYETTPNPRPLLPPPAVLVVGIRRGQRQSSSRKQRRV
jgi:hypothetical protein